MVRSEESENGIKVFDASGNLVGVSREAGFKVRMCQECYVLNSFLKKFFYCGLEVWCG